MGQDAKKDTSDSVLRRALIERMDVMGGTKGRLIRITPLPPAQEPTNEPDQQAELEAGLEGELLAAKRNDLQAEARAEVPPEPPPEPLPEAEQLDSSEQR